MHYSDDVVFQTVQQIRTPGAVEAILTAAWDEWFDTPVQGVRVTLGSTNYKPFKRARLMAEAVIVPGKKAPALTLNLFMHVFADADTARLEAEQGRARGFIPCAGPPLLHVPQWRTVLWVLPNAPTLTELAGLMDADQFCRALLPSTAVAADRPYYPAPRLVRYVPLKRAILTWDDPYVRQRYFVKLFDGADAARVVRNIRQINAAAARGELCFAVPQLVADNPAYHTLVMTEVAGQPFTEMMHHGLPAPFVAVGRMLAQLHGCTARPEVVWTPEHELAALERHMAGLKLALPQLGTPLDQILASPDGMGLVDWDTLALGDPLYDVGRLLAHLLYLAGREAMAPDTVRACAEALVAAYEAATGQTVHRHRLAWHVASQLLLRGKIAALRPLPEGWQAALAFVVAEAVAVLDGQSRYASLPHLGAVALEV